MSITKRTIKILFAAAAGRCSFTGCNEQLTFPHDEEPNLIGEMAHICGDKPNSNRHDTNQKQEERDDYQNLILLCPTHHTLIDKKENETKYSVEILKKMKLEHEQSIMNKSDHPTSIDKKGICQQIDRFLQENYQVWSQFGPSSEKARKNPHSESSHSTWLSQRLSTIVPNNRKIIKILDQGQHYFRTKKELETVASFRLHVQTYENWVQDTIEYEGVFRFPQNFEQMIRGFADAC